MVSREVRPAGLRGGLAPERRIGHRRALGARLKSPHRPETPPRGTGARPELDWRSCPCSPCPHLPSRLQSARRSSCDVLVIGGGPAGSTIAALLAERGRDVVVLEKAHHPRFHIGESLLPANVALFDRLGVREQVEAIGMQKYGVEFVSPEHEQRQFIEFADAWDKSMPYAWQVRRSRARRDAVSQRRPPKGARTFEG